MLVAASVAHTDCLSSQYIGFDSRVFAQLIARMPPTGEAVKGFAIAAGIPVVLLKSRLLIFDSAIPRDIPVPEDATGLSVDADEIIRLQRPGEVDILTEWTPRKDTSLEPKGALFDSGRPVLVDAWNEEGVEKFVLRRPGADSFGVAGARGRLRAAFWGDGGLAVIAGRSLYVWRENSDKFVRLAIDKGLEKARSVCLADGGVAVVALGRAVVVITEEDEIVLVGMEARCDSRGGIVYLLDELTGEIWQVGGIEKLGRFHEDERHARNLILQLPRGATENAPAFLEAARIVGCEKARRILEERPSK